MGQYTSYYLYQKFEKRDGQDFIPVYPNTYSIDADGTMPRVVKNENDENCGYVPPTPTYRWITITATSDPSTYICDECPGEPIYTWTIIQPTTDPSSYICDECPTDPIYRWVDSGTTCVGYDKYNRVIKQASYDGGETWTTIYPHEYSATTLIEADSEDCGYIYVEEWVNSGTTCVNGDKYYLQVKEISYDGGQTWTETSETRIGSLIESHSPDCAIYEWFDNDLFNICDECGEAQYRTVSSATTCVGYNKYAVDEYQVSYDSGTTWFTISSSTGNLIEADSEDCGYEPPIGYSGNYLTFEALEDGAFSFSGTSSSTVNNSSIQYSLDSGSTWSTLTRGNSVSVSSGNTIMWKSTTLSPTSDGIGRFSSTGSFNVEGNALSLKYGDDFEGQTYLGGLHWFDSLFSGCTNLVSAENLVLLTPDNFSYAEMFSNCTSLTTAPQLPATDLSGAEYCYELMFVGCSSLTTAPELPATTLANACYERMFRGCTSLTTAPQLPATDLSGAYACYEGMFSGCTSLTTAPSLPATTLELSCYQHMFNGCSGLTTAPSILPATNISGATYCYANMFANCSSLTTAPVLPATTLADNCYYGMFYKCTSLTTAPDLPARTLASSSYENMFYGCTSLNYVKCLATSIYVSTTICTKNWLSGVASTGTFVKYTYMSNWPRNANGIPSNWTVENATS